MDRKGPHIAQACRRLGAKLLVAGQGAAFWSRDRIVCEDGTLLEGDVEYLGVLGPQERARLMGGAIALQRGRIRQLAIERYSTQAVTPRFGRYFGQAADPPRTWLVRMSI